jgi:hypothetical protein
MGRPPVENKKQVLTARVDPALLVAFKQAAPSVGPAVEEALRLWLGREKRRQKTRPDPLARHLAPQDDAA